MQPARTFLGLEGRALLMIAVCSLTFFLDALIPALMGPLAAPMATSLSLSRTQLGAVFSSSLVGQCVGLLTIPLLTRRLGHRSIILWTTLGFGVFQALTMFVNSMDTLVASRFISGLFLGGALPSCVAAVTQSSPPERRGLAIMLLFTAYGLGGAAAGFFGGQFVDGEEWKLAFAYTGGACLLAVLACWRWMEDPPAEPVSNLQLANPKRRLLEIISPPMLGGTLLLWLMFVCALTIYYCLSSWLPTLLVDIGRSPRLAANAVGSYTSGGVISGLLIGPLIDRFGAHRILIGFFAISGGILLAIGQFMNALADWQLLTLLATCGFFMLGAYGGLNVVLTGYYPTDLRAVGIGWTKSVSRLGTVLPPIVIGYALAQGIAAESIVAAFAVPAFLIMAALMLIRRSSGGNA